MQSAPSQFYIVCVFYCFQLQSKRDNSGANSTALRDELTAANDKVKVSIYLFLNVMIFCRYIYINTIYNNIYNLAYRYKLFAHSKSFLWFQTINKDLKELKARMQAALEEKDSLSAEYQELTKKNSKLELSIRDIIEDQKGNQNQRVYFSFNIRFLRQY